MDRKKRVKRIKIILIVLFVVFLLLPSLLCGILFMKVNRLSNEIEELRVLRAMKVMAQELEDTEGQTQTEESHPLQEAENGMDQQAAVSDRQESTAERLEEEQKSEDESKRRVYLTFDDGPSVHTEAILEILDEYQVKATFFVLGKTDEYSLEMYRRIAEEGHTLAMHSYSHRYGTLYHSLEDFQSDFNQIYELLTETTGVEPMYYRFPGGSSNLVSDEEMEVFIAYLNQMGIRYFDWNVSSGDAVSKPLEADKICENVLEGSKKFRNAVVLLHDLAEKETTVEALPAILEGLLEQDVLICPINENTPLVQHVVLTEEEHMQE